MPNARLTQRLYTQQDCARLFISPIQQAWLFDRASLTNKLQAICPELKVKTRFEGWGTAYPFERQALELTHHRVWIREVSLCCETTPWIYARSVTSAVAKGQPWAFVRHQGEQPLGQRLFQDATIERDEFFFSQWQWPRLISNWPQAEYGRHCIYRRNQSPLLLSEVFLPHFWHKKTPA